MSVSLRADGNVALFNLTREDVDDPGVDEDQIGRRITAGDGDQVLEVFHGPLLFRRHPVRKRSQRLAHIAEEGAERALKLLQQGNRVGVRLIALLLSNPLRLGDKVLRLVARLAHGAVGRIAGGYLDAVRLLLGAPEDFGVADPFRRFSIGVGNDALGLCLRVGDRLLAALDNAARLADVGRDRQAQLADQVAESLAVDRDAAAERHLAAGGKLFLQLVEQVKDFDGGTP
jgi:hypothetical protein